MIEHSHPESTYPQKTNSKLTRLTVTAESGDRQFTMSFAPLNARPEHAGSQGYMLVGSDPELPDRQKNAIYYADVIQAGEEFMLRPGTSMAQKAFRALQVSSPEAL